MDIRRQRFLDRWLSVSINAPVVIGGQQGDGRRRCAVACGQVVPGGYSAEHLFVFRQGQPFDESIPVGGDIAFVVGAGHLESVRKGLRVNPDKKISLSIGGRLTMVFDILHMHFGFVTECPGIEVEPGGVYFLRYRRTQLIAGAPGRPGGTFFEVRRGKTGENGFFPTGFRGGVKGGFGIGQAFVFFPLSAFRDTVLQFNLRFDFFAVFPADNHLASMHGKDRENTFLIFVLSINIKFNFCRLVHGTSCLDYIINLFVRQYGKQDT